MAREEIKKKVIEKCHAMFSNAVFFLPVFNGAMQTQNGTKEEKKK